jgi:Zn-dependent protease with chaperone function
MANEGKRMISQTLWSGLRTVTALPIVLGLGACTPPYEPPAFSDASLNYAAVVIAEEKQAAASQPGASLGESAARKRFSSTMGRVVPVAEEYCRRSRPDAPQSECDLVVRILADNRYPPNASQTYDETGRPLVYFSNRLVLEARNQDELAFALAHEVGHHLADHTAERQRQAELGLFFGVVLAVAAASQPTSTPTTIPNPMGMSDAFANVYSQSQELEADALAARITRAAGFDPNRGARLFARVKAPRTADGQLSLWGTIPGDRGLPEP